MLSRLKNGIKTWCKHTFQDLSRSQGETEIPTTDWNKNIPDRTCLLLCTLENATLSRRNPIRTVTRKTSLLLRKNPQTWISQPFQNSRYSDKCKIKDYCSRIQNFCAKPYNLQRKILATYISTYFLFIFVKNIHFLFRSFFIDLDKTKINFLFLNAIYCHNLRSICTISFDEKWNFVLCTYFNLKDICPLTENKNHGTENKINLHVFGKYYIIKLIYAKIMNFFTKINFFNFQNSNINVSKGKCKFIHKY